MGKAGRKALYSEELTRKVEGFAALGITDRVIYEAVGISHETFYKWIREKPEFARRLARARSLGQAKLVKSIIDAIPKSWRAASWLLERRWPEEFGRREVLKHEGGGVISFAEGLKEVYEHIKSNPELMAKIEDDIRDW